MVIQRYDFADRVSIWICYASGGWSHFREAAVVHREELLNVSVCGADQLICSNNHTRHSGYAETLHSLRQLGFDPSNNLPVPLGQRA